MLEVSSAGSIQKKKNQWVKIVNLLTGLEISWG